MLQLSLSHKQRMLCMLCLPVMQMLWSFSLMLFLPVLLALMPGSYSLSKDFPLIPHTHVDVVSGAAACVSFIGELFMIKASLTLGAGGMCRVDQQCTACRAKAQISAAWHLQQGDLCTATPCCPAGRNVAIAVAQHKMWGLLS